MQTTSLMQRLDSYADYVLRSAFFSAKGYGIRMMRSGKAFYRLLEELEESQWSTREQFQELQNAKLRALIRHSYDNVPYYRRLFDIHGLKPKDIQSTSDLYKIPTLTKDDLRANPDDFVAKNINRRLLATGWTTGSTGTPLAVRRTLHSIIFDNASMTRQRGWAGVKKYDRKVAIWGTSFGHVIVPRRIGAAPFWRFNAADNQMFFSYHHLSDDTLSAFADGLRKFRPVFIEAFPSTMLMLARFLKKQNARLPLKAIFTTSEPLYRAHRQEIEEVFKTQIFDYYGHAERAVTAAECEYGNMHINPEYGVLEVLQGDETLPLGQSGEIVGTSLNNFGMPLIRYRTGDGSRLIDVVCRCGRHTQILGGIEGRTADFIRTPDGQIMPGDGVMEAFYGLDNIKESQVVQNDLDRIIIKIVKDDEKVAVNTKSLVTNFQRCLGNEMRITVKFVPSISDDDSSKRRWVVSNIGGELN